MWRFSIAAILAASTFHVNAQTLGYFTTLCTAEKSTGFNWKKRDWDSVDFKPTQSFLMQKISQETYKSKDTKIDISTALACSSMNETFDGVLAFGYREEYGCYLRKKLNAPTYDTSEAYQCVETFDSKLQLKDIKCKGLAFLPNGRYVSLPHELSLDVGDGGKGDYKDAMTLNVGRCTPITPIVK